MRTEINTYDLTVLKSIDHMAAAKARDPNKVESVIVIEPEFQTLSFIHRQTLVVRRSTRIIIRRAEAGVQFSLAQPHDGALAE